MSIPMRMTMSIPMSMTIPMTIPIPILMRTTTGIPMPISTGTDTHMFIETCLGFSRVLTDWNPMTV